MITQKLFTELLRPKSFDKMVLTSRIRSEIEKGLTQNILMYGPAGCGKSTIARILTEPYDTLSLNGSLETGIDIIREKVVSFASSLSLEFGVEKMKVIFIDEADGLTEQAWDALRETIEHYASSVRYVCTCNKIEKIPAPIKSRFNCMPVYPINKDEEAELLSGYVYYVGSILSGFGISYDDETLSLFVKNSFPDMRTIINSIQTLYTKGVSELDRSSIVSVFDCSDLFSIIVNGVDPVDNYKFVMSNYSSSPDDAMNGISRTFIDYIRMNNPEQACKIPYIIIAIAEYMSQLNTATDKVIVLLACIFKLQQIIKSNI